MNIGQAAQVSGISAKMIRYYEASGLLPAAARRLSGYRDYDHADIQRLRFVRRSRELGFSMQRIKELLGLWNDRSKGNSEVRQIARSHIDDMRKQAEKLQAMIGTLEHLVRSCRGERREDCPIIADLGDGVAHAHVQALVPARRSHRGGRPPHVSVAGRDG